MWKNNGLTWGHKWGLPQCLLRISEGFCWPGMWMNLMIHPPTRSISTTTKCTPTLTRLHSSLRTLILQPHNHYQRTQTIWFWRVIKLCPGRSSFLIKRTATHLAQWKIIRLGRVCIVTRNLRTGYDFTCFCCYYERNIGLPCRQASYGNPTLSMYVKFKVKLTRELQNTMCMSPSSARTTMVEEWQWEVVRRNFYFFNSKHDPVKALCCKGPTCHNLFQLIHGTNNRVVTSSSLALEDCCMNYDKATC